MLQPHDQAASGACTQCMAVVDDVDFVAWPTVVSH